MTSIDAPINLEASVYTTREEIAECLSESCEFFETAPSGCSFFNDPRVVQSVLLANSSLWPLSVVVRRNGTIVCMAACAVTPGNFNIRFSVFRLLSMRVRIASVFGGTFLTTNDSHSEQYLRQALRALADHSRHFDLLILDQMNGADHPVSAVLAALRDIPDAALQAGDIRTDVTYRLQLPLSFDEYLLSLGQNTRKKLRRQANKLAQAHGGPVRLERLTQPEQVSGFLGAVDEIFRDTWQARTYGFYSRQSDQTRQHLAQVARQGWLRCYLLWWDAEPVAFQVGYQHQGVFYAWEFGYKQSRATEGPGSLLMFLMLEDVFRENRPAVVDLGPGDSPQKRTFRAMPTDLDVVTLVSSRKWRRWFRVRSGLEHVERRVRRLLVGLRLDRRVRHLLKRRS